MRRPEPIRTAAAILIAAAAVSPTPALAQQSGTGWRHFGEQWLPEDMPLRYWVADNGEDGVICVDDPATLYIDEQYEIDTDGDGVGDTPRLNCCEETVPGGHCTEAAIAAWDAWSDIDCAYFEGEYAGVSANFGTQTDNTNHITFNDPNDDIEELGTLAVTFTRVLGEAFVFDGVVYSHSYDSDTVLNDDVVFGTPAELDAPDCDEVYDIEAILVHEVGHIAGLGHSCDEDSLCADPVSQAAVMYWHLPDCRTARPLSPADIEGLRALYGPSVSHACSVVDGEPGIVPYKVYCSVQSPWLDDITVARWSFGDGGTAEGIAVSHTYTEPGSYMVTLEVEGASDWCDDGTWHDQALTSTAISACGPPETEFEAGPRDGLAWQMLNQTEIPAEGCITDILWEVYRGDEPVGAPELELRAWEPEIQFPEPGTWTVVAHIGGPAGTEAARLTLNVRDQPFVCATGSASPTAGLWIVLATLGLARRR